MLRYLIKLKKPNQFSLLLIIYFIFLLCFSLLNTHRFRHFRWFQIITNTNFREIISFVSAVDPQTYYVTDYTAKFYLLTMKIENIKAL